jgi:ABC-type amino acid transport substrate-binding protein
MRAADGSWSGISIDLWQDIAQELDLDYHLEERDLSGLLRGVEDGSLDVAVSPLAILAENEQRVDFTQPYFRTGLALAISHRGHGFLSLLRQVVAGPILGMIVLTLVLLIGVSLLVWTFERRDNPEQFGGPGAAGVWSAFWWAASTMTTVGYGDKAPITVAGRAVAIVWMFSGIVLLSGFTASVTTVLALRHLGPSLQRIDDLSRIWVATVPGSSGEAYLQREGAHMRLFPDLTGAIRAVAHGEVDAVVYDEPILRYVSSHEFPGAIDVLPGTVERESYGFALPLGSPLRKSINVALLRHLDSPLWPKLTRLYLGH